MSSRRVALDGEAAASPPRGIAKQMSERFEKMSAKPRASPPASFSSPSSPLSSSSPSSPSSSGGSYSSRTLPRSAFSAYQTALRDEGAGTTANGHADGADDVAAGENGKSGGSGGDGGGEGLRSWARMRRVDYKAVAAQRKGSSAASSPPQPSAS
jgi:cell division septation protein DedD